MAGYKEWINLQLPNNIFQIGSFTTSKCEAHRSPGMGALLLLDAPLPPHCKLYRHLHLL